MAARVRVADLIVQLLEAHGVRHSFLVTGGGAMHLNDAFGRSKKIEWIPCHHEQACTIAADAYFRLHNRIAAVNVTSGPGGTNAITGVYGAFVDSLGMIVVSGNVKWETLARSTDLPLRQLGDQEVDIIKLVAPVTKYAEMITDPTTVRYHVEKALHLATTGRPGPVWIDVPMNVQGALIDPDQPGYDPAEDLTSYADVSAACDDIVARLRAAERPVILASSGVRLAGAREDFIRLVDHLGIPVTTAWNAHDLIWDEHPLYVGRQGTVGDRAGNLAVQNADLLLSLGCRLSIRQVSYDWGKFARAAFKIVVDIDRAELAKPTIKPDLPVHANVADVIRELLGRSNEGLAKPSWLAWCRERRARYPVVLPEYWSKQTPVNPYCFVDALFDQLADDDVVVTGDGTCAVVGFQAAKLKRGQRLFHNSGAAPMGYDLPAAVGACLANGRKRTICLAGDGSIMMNLQELQTIVTQRLPIKIFVINNAGYHSIRQTQQAYFKDSPIGYDAASGVELPEFAKVAAAFNMPFHRCVDQASLHTTIARTLAEPSSVMCEIVADPDQPFAPKLSSRRLADGRMVSSPLEDMAPFLSREELAENMLVPMLKE